MKLIASLILLMATAAIAADFQAVTCEGTYSHHLQGVCTDDKDAIFWCFTTKLVKTDRSGKVVKQVDVANHHGDLCFHKGKVFVALKFLVARGGITKDKGHTGRLVMAISDKQSGLQVVNK